MPVESLQVVAVPVADQDRAKDFYVDVLGWDLLSDQSYPLGNGKTARVLVLIVSAIALIVLSVANRLTSSPYGPRQTAL